MRTINLLLWTLGLLFLNGCRLSGQEVPQRLKTTYEPLNERLAKLVTVDSMALSPAEARKMKTAVFLDARETEEYNVSHLPGARNIGYDRPDFSVLKGVSKSSPLVVYCTVGYRSERLADKLRKRGFTQVHNLYGSIYAWKLAGLPVVDKNGPTDRIHTYNKKWGSYVPDSIGEKVY